MRSRTRNSLIFAAIALLAIFSSRDAHAQEARREVVAGWFTPPPFQRIVDLEAALGTGYPDTWGGCVELNPLVYFAADACVFDGLKPSTFFHLKSRLLSYASFAPRGERDWSGDQVSFGPVLGVGSITLNGPGDVDSAYDVRASLEWVHWFSRFAGIGLQFEAGAYDLVWENSTHRGFVPNARFTIGPSF